MILVGGDRCELGLGEDEGLEVLRCVNILSRWVDVDDMKARLVAVHRVQYHLQILPHVSDALFR